MFRTWRTRWLSTTTVTLSVKKYCPCLSFRCFLLKKKNSSCYASILLMLQNRSEMCRFFKNNNSRKQDYQVLMQHWWDVKFILRTFCGIRVFNFLKLIFLDAHNWTSHLPKLQWWVFVTVVRKVFRKMYKRAKNHRWKRKKKAYKKRY